MSMSYPSQIEIVPLAKPPSCDVTVPGSKSITNRALVLAALSGFATLEGVLRSEDTEVMIDCLRKLGWEITPDWERHTVTCEYDASEWISHIQFGWEIPRGQADLFVANSGTTIRFLTALVALGEGNYRLDGIPRMRERPIQDLVDSLKQLGVDIYTEAGTGCPPVIVNARGIQGGTVRVRSNLSSQYLSGLLLALPFAKGDTVVTIEGEVVSEPYIEMTLRMLEQVGLRYTRDGQTISVPGRQRPQEQAFPYAIEPDASAASYFWAAAAIAGGRVTVRGLTRKSLQGDVAFVDALAQMGCRVEECDSGITVHGKPLHGIDIDMNAISDTVMSLGAVALFAEGPTTIRNVAHIRHKETDRIAALATELRKFGAEVDEFPDGLRIIPRSLTGATVDTYNDHRMAMSLALVGLRVPGVKVNNPGCVAKTYPEFWQDFEKLRSQPYRPE